MRHGLVALALLGVAVGCSSSAADEGISQTSNDTEKAILTQLASSLSITEVPVRD